MSGGLRIRVHARREGPGTKAKEETTRRFGLRRWFIVAALGAALALVAAACTSAKDVGAPAAGGGAVVPAPAAGGPGAPAVAAGMWAKPPIGKTWAEYFGIEPEKTFDTKGKRVVNPKPGQLYFYTNSGTTWGATNTKNSVVVFDATDMRNWKHVATTNLPDEYSLGYSSHGATVSADGRWIYLQSMANPQKPSRLIVIDGFTLKPYKVYKETAPGFGGHHLNNFTGPDGREYVMNVDFNWNWSGSGGWVLDPAKDHAIVGGMNRQDFSGNPYVFTGDIQKKWMFATVPAPSAALRGKMEGYLAKIDMEKWKVVGAVPVLDPIWAEVTQDGKIAWVTEGDGQKVKKIDLEKMAVISEVSTGPGPWGARLSCDESRLYVADKGESAGYAQQGRTMTIIDTQFDIVTNVVPIGRTTDHVILSPDCKYVIANSNADHGLWIYDAATEKLVATVKIPNGGDPHGGTFVRWRDNGKGGVVGEVVSTLTGLRGSARAAQQKLIADTKAAVVVRVNPKNTFAGTPTSFSPDTVTVKPGSAVTLLFSYASGTSGPTLAIESKDAKIARFKVKPGERHLAKFTAPRSGKLLVSFPGDRAAKPLTIVVGEVPAQMGATAPTAREVKITASGLKWDITALALKVGEQVKFTLANQDDEKHNLRGDTVGLLSPDVAGGQTTSFVWTVSSTTGTHKFYCQYHPSMVIQATIAK